MARVTLQGVSKTYGEFVALRELHLQVKEGEFLTLLGPSGCGKTTTLRMVAGFVTPTTGTIYFGDEEVTRLPPQKRGIGMVFQDYALFPHMTVAENIAFGLVERKVGRENVRQRVKELLNLIQLSGVEDRYPSALSGGQQQRVAVARAVAFAPRVLLMDEPLGALDLKLREAMQFEIRRIQQELKITTIYVTHDQTEAMHMSDRIAVMNHGVMEQIGTAEQIYAQPKTRFVADFIGQINLLPVRWLGHEGGCSVVDLAGSRVLAQPSELAGSEAITIAIRPEHLDVVTNGEDLRGRNCLEGVVAARVFSGNVVKVEISLPTGRVFAELKPEAAAMAPGEPVRVAWEPRHTLVLAQ